MRPDALLIDGNNLAHRCWHVSGERPANATDTLDRMIRRVLRAQMPAFAAVAFDSPDCFRRDLYPGYKAGRGERPLDQDGWLERLPAVLGSMGHNVVAAPRHEADDVIATLVAEAQRRRFSTAIVTADKDAYALVHDGEDGRAPVWVLSPEGVTIAAIGVRNGKIGVWPGQVRAYKALAGDSSDGIAGVPGIGPVFARRILQAEAPDAAFETLLDALDDESIRRRLQVPLDEAKRLGRLAYDLVGLVADAPVDRTLDDCRTHWATRLDYAKATA